MFCSSKNMFGLKNIANILGVPQEDTFAQPSAPSSSYCDKISKKNMFVNSADANHAKENGEVLTKGPSPPSPKQASVSVPTVVAPPPLPDDASETEDYVDIPYDDIDIEAEELRRELASARQALKDAQMKLATEKVEKVKIQEELDVVQAKKVKVVGNLRNKRSLLVQVQAKNVQLEQQLACEQSKHKVASDETLSLRASLMSASASREDLKQKLKSRQESLKQAKLEQEDLESKLAKVEGQHETENELLTLLRKLACHTGYFKWGKQIRGLESKLSDAAEEAAAAARNNTGDSNRSPEKH
jgi:DNA repair exonuclease SbcCD ATPase subunit